jgi:hypothetical protein
LTLALQRAIVDIAEAKRCDLIFMASHDRHGVSAIVLGSETVKVLTHCKVPILDEPTSRFSDCKKGSLFLLRCKMSVLAASVGSLTLRFIVIQDSPGLRMCRRRLGRL